MSGTRKSTGRGKKTNALVCVEPRPVPEMAIFLPGPVPSKKNSRITNRRTGRSFPSERYVDWHKRSMRELSSRRGWQVQGKEGVEVRIVFGLPDMRRRDLTNMAESIMDLLVDAGILADDNWRECPVVALRGELQKANPGAAIRLQGVGCS